MLIKFILAVVALTIIICNPILLFLCAGFAIAWVVLKRPDLFTKLPSYLTTPGEGGNEPEEDLSLGKEYPTPEEIYTREVESKMKPGYKDDPKWQELTKKIGKHVEEAQRKEEREMYLEDLTNKVV